MMHMTFYWGTKVTLLFDFWRTETWVDYSLTLIACALFSAFYQYLEHRRIQLNKISTSTTAVSTAPTPVAPDQNSIESPLLIGSSNKTAAVRIWGPRRFAGALMFGINSAIGYMLMLAVMSFNGGVFVAVIVGLCVGQLLFRDSPREDVLLVDNPCACA